MIRCCDNDTVKENIRITWELDNNKYEIKNIPSYHYIKCDLVYYDGLTSLNTSLLAEMMEEKLLENVIDYGNVKDLIKF